MNESNDLKCDCPMILQDSKSKKEYCKVSSFLLVSSLFKTGDNTCGEVSQLLGCKNLKQDLPDCYKHICL